MMLLNLLAIKIDVQNFLDSLPYAGIGMIGIFIVIGVIIIATITLGAIENKIKESKAKKQEQENE